MTVEEDNKAAFKYIIGFSTFLFCGYLVDFVDTGDIDILIFAGGMYAILVFISVSYCIDIKNKYLNVFCTLSSTVLLYGLLFLLSIAVIVSVALLPTFRV